MKESLLGVTAGRTGEKISKEKNPFVITGGKGLKEKAGDPSGAQTPGALRSCTIFSPIE